MSTLCWHCNAPYAIVDRTCPKCGATNPNVDLETAYAEIEDKTRIVLRRVQEDLPALLREQAA